MIEYKLKDLMLYFGGRAEPQSSGPSAPCPNSAQIRVQEAHLIALDWDVKNVTFYSATITIGTKWLGRMDALQQYEVFIRDIKRHFKSPRERYIFHFELQSNGLLHAHGLCTHYPKIMEKFVSYGNRNKHNQSYQKTKHVAEYLNYINKENIYPAIHNYTNDELIEAELAPTIDLVGAPNGGS